MFPSSTPSSDANHTSPRGVESPASTTSVEHLESIAGIDRAAWDRLAPDDVFGSYGWLRTVEETSRSSRPMYFVVREAGAPVAAAPCHSEGGDGLGMDRILIGRFARIARPLRIGVSPALVCGTPIGLSEHIRIDPSASPEQRRHWTLLLIDAMERFARGRKLTLCFRNVIDHVGPLAQTLEHRGYLRATEMPTTVMDVRWASFAEYRRDLKRDHPATAKNIPGEMNRARKAGIVFRKLGDAIPHASRLHAILEAHSRRLNGVPFPFRTEFLETLRRHLGDKLIVYVALDAEDPIGVTVVMRAGDAVFHSMVGMDIARSRKGLVYFSAAYNVPIDDAIANGVRRIYCGKLHYGLKLRRGFRLVDLSAYLHVADRWRAALLKPVLAVQRARVRRILRGVRALDPGGDVA